MPHPCDVESFNEPLRSRRFLITGGSGFIGRHLLAHIVSSAAEVHATSRSRPPEQRGVQWWRVDLTDPVATRNVVEQVRPDVVIHLASRVVGSRDMELVAPMINDNLVSAVNIMAAASGVPGCRVVLAGSVEEQCEGEAGAGACSPYSASKAAATIFATLFRDLWDLPVVVLRLAMVYGPGDPNGKRLMPYVIASLLRGVEPELSSGLRQIDWVYVDDVVDALLAAAVEPAALGRVMDVGSGSMLTIRDTTLLIAEVVGSGVTPAFGRLPDRPGDRDLLADPGPAQRYLDWRARVGLRDGIERTVAWQARRMIDGEGLPSAAVWIATAL
jgi:nucleoside-diphosphate-sugar epimerase